MTYGYYLASHFVMKLMILGINNEYELSDFDDSFLLMVRRFAFWLELLACFVLDESHYATEISRLRIFIFLSQFFAKVVIKCRPIALFWRLDLISP